MNQNKKNIWWLLIPFVSLGLLLMVSSVSADPASIIIIGDSRAYEMHDTVGDSGVYWVTKVGMGYDWMVSEGVPAAEPYIGEGTAVVITLGVNDVRDLFRTDEYAQYLNTKAAEWSKLGAAVYYVSVTPVDDALDHEEHNSDIAAWNQQMLDKLDSEVRYLDLNSALGTNYSTVDGLHYNYDTYRRIFDLIMSGVSAYQGAMLQFEPQEIEEDDALVPHMKMTAADTEDSEESVNDGYQWEMSGGELYCTDSNGRPAEGICVIGKMVCVFGENGKLQFSFRK